MCKPLAQVMIADVRGSCYLKAGLKNLQQNGFREAWAARRLTGVLLVVLSLVLLAMAQSEELHHAIHADSNQPNHHCAATMLRCGQVDAPPSCEVTVVVPQAVVMMESSRPPAILVSFDYTLLPSCGPPAILS